MNSNLVISVVNTVSITHKENVVKTDMNTQWEPVAKLDLITQMVSVAQMDLTTIKESVAQLKCHTMLMENVLMIAFSLETNIALIQLPELTFAQIAVEPLRNAQKLQVITSATLQLNAVLIHMLIAKSTES